MTGTKKGGTARTTTDPTKNHPPTHHPQSTNQHQQHESEQLKQPEETAPLSKPRQPTNTTIAEKVTKAGPGTDPTNHDQESAESDAGKMVTGGKKENSPTENQ
jgi:hypothetical protein